MGGVQYDSPKKILPRNEAHQKNIMYTLHTCKGWPGTIVPA